jgi:hypothetical protein
MVSPLCIPFCISCPSCASRCGCQATGGQRHLHCWACWLQQPRLQHLEHLTGLVPSAINDQQHILEARQSRQGLPAIRCTWCHRSGTHQVWSGAHKWATQGHVVDMQHDLLQSGCMCCNPSTVQPFSSQFEVLGGMTCLWCAATLGPCACTAVCAQATWPGLLCNTGSTKGVCAWAAALHPYLLAPL